MPKSNERSRNLTLSQPTPESPIPPCILRYEIRPATAQDWILEPGIAIAYWQAITCHSTVSNPWLNRQYLFITENCSYANLFPVRLFYVIGHTLHEKVTGAHCGTPRVTTSRCLRFLGNGLYSMSATTTENDAKAKRLPHTSVNVQK